MRTDVHTHAFHEKIARKAAAQLMEHYHHDLAGTGTVENLISFLDRGKIDLAFVHSAATRPDQVIPANSWAIDLKSNPRFIPFGTIHPDYPGWEDELSRLSKNSIKGIKFHPDFQGFNMDDEKMFPLYEAISGKFLVMFHVGDVFPPHENPSSPQKLAAVLKNFPKLKAIAAHLGGYAHWKWVVESLSGLDFFMDTSSSLKYIPENLLKEILDSFPKECFLFGTDYPLGDPVEEFELLEKKAGFSGSEIEQLLERGGRLLA